MVLPHSTAKYPRVHGSWPFAPPARRAVLRRQRQRGSPLWTPFHRLRAGRGEAGVAAADFSDYEDIYEKGTRRPERQHVPLVLFENCRWYGFCPDVRLSILVFAAVMPQEPDRQEKCCSFGNRDGQPHPINTEHTGERQYADEDKSKRPCKGDDRGGPAV